MRVSSDAFTKNFAWLVGSEGVVRLTRLVTAVALARFLDVSELGIAALAIASHELMRLLAQNGFGLKVIRADNADLDALCQSLYLLNWLWSGVLFSLQVAASFLFAHYYSNSDLQTMIAVLACVYLTMPLGLTQMYRVQRDQRLKVTAWVDSTQVMIDNVLTAALAVAGFGAWSVVLPKLLVTPIWVVGYRLACDWRFSFSAPRLPWRAAFSETRGWLSSEFARGMRSQLDVFVVGRLLGTEALGFYYFARNAGLGISLSLLQAATHAMLPKLGQIARERGMTRTFAVECRRVLKLVVIVTVPIIAAQALLAPLYVPFVFGEKWSPAIPVLILLCLSALPRVLGESMAQVARVAGMTNNDARWNIWSTPVFFCTVFVGCHYGLIATAFAVLCFHLAYQWLFVAVMSRRLQFKVRQQDLAMVPEVSRS